MTIEEKLAYLSLCAEEAKSKDWGDGIKFALELVKDDILTLDSRKDDGIHFDIEKHDREISDKWLDKIKQARNEIEHLSKYGKETYYRAIDDVLAIIDKLTESEEGYYEDNRGDQ